MNYLLRLMLRLSFCPWNVTCTGKKVLPDFSIRNNHAQIQFHKSEIVQLQLVEGIFEKRDRPQTILNQFKMNLLDWNS